MVALEARVLSDKELPVSPNLYRSTYRASVRESNLPFPSISSALNKAPCGLS